MLTSGLARGRLAKEAVWLAPLENPSRQALAVLTLMNSMLRTVFRLSFSILLIVLFNGATHAASRSPSRSLPRGTPEAQGIASAAILDFIETADRQINSLHSFMLVRNGQVVAEAWWAPYDAGSRHELYSLSKSFTSTAVGFAVAEGLLSIDDPLLKLFPDDAPSDPSPNLRSMRLRDLLCMSAGHERETSSAPDQISARSFLAHPVPFKPGTRFLYNTPATFMLSAAVQKVTGQTVLEYLRPRLFEPLGIEDPVWTTNHQGMSLGGYGLSVRTEDIAKFGQLYLQKGRWNRKELLPASWVEMATGRQTSNGSHPESDWDQGYGFQFWRCRHGAYRGDGAFGQYCIVLPEQDAVIAITGGVRDMQAVLNLVWDKLLPALQDRRAIRNREAADALKARLGSLTLRTPTGAVTSPRIAELRGKRYVFPANDQQLESLEVAPGEGAGGTTLLIRIRGVDYRVPCGHGSWTRGRIGYGTLGERPVAASGAWVAEDTFQAKFCFYETPFVLSVNLRFTGDQLLHDSEFNASFGPTRQPALVGRVF